MTDKEIIALYHGLHCVDNRRLITPIVCIDPATKQVTVHQEEAVLTAFIAGMIHQAQEISEERPPLTRLPVTGHFCGLFRAANRLVVAARTKYYKEQEEEKQRRDAGLST